MKIRAAGCGHDYEGGVRGPVRKVCPDCAVPLSPNRLEERQLKAAAARWGHAPDQKRALCGHLIDWYPGPALRRCPPCEERAPCVGCGAAMDARPRQAKYCSERCSLVSNGRVRAEALPGKTCALPECSVDFVPKMRTQRCCCEAHGAILCRRERRADGREAAPEWTEQRRAYYHRRRAQKAGTSTVENVTRDYIAKRDRWLCHLCTKPVDPAVLWPDPMSPSLDHVIPLSKGGEHTRANVRLAHLVCNIRKSNRSCGEQLALLG